MSKNFSVIMCAGSMFFFGSSSFGMERTLEQRKSTEQKAKRLSMMLQKPILFDDISATGKLPKHEQPVNIVVEDTGNPVEVKVDLPQRTSDKENATYIEAVRVKCGLAKNLILFLQKNDKNLFEEDKNLLNQIYISLTELTLSETEARKINSPSGSQGFSPRDTPQGIALNMRRDVSSKKILELFLRKEDVSLEDFITMDKVSFQMLLTDKDLLNTIIDAPPNLLKLLLARILYEKIEQKIEKSWYCCNIM